MHLELDQINEEIQQAELQNQPKASEPPQIGNLSQWFETYGRPNMTEEKRNRLTSFDKSAKIYGGTEHYKSFKTMSATMVKGRVTR